MSTVLLTTCGVSTPLSVFPATSQAFDTSIGPFGGFHPQRAYQEIFCLAFQLLRCGVLGGPYWDRTSHLLLAKQALYPNELTAREAA